VSRLLTLLAVAALAACGGPDRLVDVPDYPPTQQMDGGVPDGGVPMVTYPINVTYVRTGSSSSTPRVAVAVCPAGTGIVGGGCDCNGDPWFPDPAGSARASQPLIVNGESTKWSCMCNSAPAIATAICTNVLANL
jgi:hypothetical protein